MPDETKEVASVVSMPKRAGRAPKTTLSMKRNAEQYPGPHTAEVHPEEVGNWARHGWERAE